MNKVKFDFSKANIVVTGASSGMGRQLVIELADAGANVLAIARREDRLLALKALYPMQIMVASVDVCDYGAVKEAIGNFVHLYGKLQGGVHAAGIVAVTPLRSYDRDLAHHIMDVSFWAGVDFLQLCIKKSYSEDGASFVLFSSVDSVAAWKGKFAYSGAKMALNSAVKSIAKEIARRRQRVNTVLPGWVETEMTQATKEITDMESIAQRELLGMGTPADVTGMVMFLLSDRSNWITGTNIAVDGGYLA